MHETLFAIFQWYEVLNKCWLHNRILNSHLLTAPSTKYAQYNHKSYFNRIFFFLYINGMNISSSYLFIIWHSISLFSHGPAHTSHLSSIIPLLICSPLIELVISLFLHWLQYKRAVICSILVKMLTTI